MERIERLVHAAFDLVRENLPFWRLSYQPRMQPGVVEGLGAGVGEWIEATRHRLESLLREAGVPSPELQSRLLFAAIDGAAQHFALDPERYPVEEVADALVRRFLVPVTNSIDEPTQEIRAFIAGLETRG